MTLTQADSPGAETLDVRPTASRDGDSDSDGASAILAATGAASILNYLYTVLIVWLLPPHEYATVGSVSALLLIWGTVAGAGVPWVLAHEVAQSAPGSRRRAAAVTFSLTATAVQALGAAGATVALAARYADPLTLCVAALAVVLIFAAATVAGYLQGTLRFRRLALLRVGEVLVKLLSGLALVILGGGPAAAIAGFSFGATIVVLGAGRLLVRESRRGLRPLLSADLWLRTGKLVSVQAGVAVLMTLDVVVGSLTLGARSVLATYQAANILGRVPLFIGASLSIVVFPRLVRDPRGRATEVGDSLRLFVRICIPGALVALTCPASLVGAVFPHAYGNVATTLRWTALAGVGLGLVNLTTTYFQAIGVVRRAAATVTVGAAAGAVADYLGLRIDGIRGLAVAVVLVSAAIACALLSDVAKTWPGCLRPARRAALTSIVLGLPLVVARSSPGLWLVAASACAVAPVLEATFRSDRLRPDRRATADSHRRRILHLGYEDPARPGAGGGSLRTHEINRRLVDRFDVTVVCAAFPGCCSRIEDGVLYTHVGLRTRHTKIAVLSYFLLIPLALYRHRSELVIEDFGAPLSTVGVPWMTTRPVIGQVQWLFAREKTSQYRVPFHAVERLGLRAHRNLIAVSDDLGAALARRNRRAEVTVIPNGLEGGVGRIEPGERAGIAFLGRLEAAQKGLDLLLEAYAGASKDIVDDLFIGGDGPDDHELRTMASDLGIADRVHFLGRIGPAQRLGWLASARFVVMPSRYETFGMVAAEALSVQTSVIAYDIPCLRSLVDNETGILVPAYDVPALGEAIRRLAQDPDLARRLGACGPLKVADLDWDRLAESQARLYLSTLGAIPARLTMDG